MTTSLIATANEFCAIDIALGIGIFIGLALSLLITAIIMLIIERSEEVNEQKEKKEPTKRQLKKELKKIKEQFEIKELEEKVQEAKENLKKMDNKDIPVNTVEYPWEDDEVSFFDSLIKDIESDKYTFGLECGVKILKRCSQKFQEEKRITKASYYERIGHNLEKYLENYTTEKTELREHYRKVVLTLIDTYLQHLTIFYYNC